MTFIVLFEDDPTADRDIRTNHMAQHLAFLERHADVIQAAGPLTDVAAGGRDGLWIVEAAAQSDVERLIKDDPFWPTGLRKSHAILPWKQVFAGGRRLIEP